MFNKILIALLTLCAHLSAEQTLALIKPDAVAACHVGAILDRFDKSGLRLAALKMVQLSPEKASELYAEHKERPFYKDLVAFMSSGPIVAIVLDAPDAIAKNRALMGDTDPQKAAPGTLRKDFGTSRGKNAVHGSDSKEAAKREIAFFFTPAEIVNK